MEYVKRKWNLELDIIKFIACCAVIFLYYSENFCGRKFFGGGWERFM